MEMRKDWKMQESALWAGEVHLWPLFEVALQDNVILTSCDTDNYDR